MLLLISLNNIHVKKEEINLPDMKNELISIDELCETLMIGKNLASRLLTEKQIKAFKIGKKWKIPRSSVKSYIEENLQ